MGRKKKEVENQSETAATEKPEYPFLKQPAEQGGVIIGTEDRDGTRPLTEADLAAAREEQFKTAGMLRETQARGKDLAGQEKRDEAQLKGTREAIRKAEEESLRLGDELATYAEEVHSGVRKIKFPSVLTLTKGNEVVVTDARSGKEIERRTATKEELDQGLFKDGALFGSRDPKSTPGPDHPMGKPVTVSIDTAAYGKTKKTIKDSLVEVFAPNDDPDDGGHNVAWFKDGDRSKAIVPAWVAHRLKEIASRDKALDFKVEGDDDGRELVTVEVGK